MLTAWPALGSPQTVLPHAQPRVTRGFDHFNVSVTICPQHAGQLRCGSVSQAMELGSIHPLVVLAGSSIRGVIVQRECAMKRWLLLPQAHREAVAKAAAPAARASGRCPLASFVLRLSGPERLVPRVTPVWFSHGHYRFEEDLTEVGEYTMQLRLDFMSDKGIWSK